MKDVKKKKGSLSENPLELSPPVLLSNKTESTNRKKTSAGFPSQTNGEFLKSVLNGIDALIYVADMGTYRVLFLDKYGKTICGSIERKQCCQTLQAGQKGPCPFCTNKELLDPHGKPKGLYIWESQNTGTQQWQKYRDLAIKWADQRCVKLAIVSDITERKIVEETLKKSEQTVQTLLNANPETELPVDKKSIILAGNNTFAKRMGRDIRDIIGQSFSDVFPPDVATSREMKIKEAIATGQLVHFADSRDGVIYDNYHYPVFDESGNVEMVAIFAMDITDRIKAEEALRESEERYRTAIEFSNDGVAILKGGIHVYVNRKFVEMFGYDDASEIIGKTHAVTVHPDDLELVSEINKRRQRGKAVPLRYEFKGIKKNGEIIYIESSSANTQYQGESVSLAYLRDITERKLSSDALRDSEIKYHTLLDNVNDAILLLSKDLFIDCNEKALTIFGCTRENIIGKNPSHLSPPTQPDGRNSQEKASEIIETALSGKPQIFEWQHSQLDGTIFDTEVSLNAIDLGGKIYTQVIIRDITQRKQYDQSLKMSLAKLRKATGGIIDVIVMAVEMRDPYTAGHQKRVASLARSIAKEMGLTEASTDGVRMAGIIHDLGKISIPAEILTRPRKLTPTEYDLVKTHPQIGYDMLKDIVFPWPIAQIVHQHHERLNGTGYPRGLKQADILLEARIIAVCDVVESMASHRPYRPALGIDKALEEITTNKGVLYDAAVVDTCVRLFKQKGFSFD